MNTPENTNTASHSAPAGAGVDWELRYQTGDTPWKKGHAHPALIEWLTHTPITGRVLVPGCGEGHDVRAIANNATEVLGIDIAPSAKLLADSFARVGNEAYVLGDFLKSDASQMGPFDWIFEHTCLCAIPPNRRKDYVAATVAALQPGGKLLAVFYTNPDNPNHESPPFACTDMDMDTLFDPLFETLKIQHPIPTYPEREGRETLRLFQKRASLPSTD